VLVHRAGKRGAVPRHAAAGRLLLQPDRAGAEGVRCRPGPPVPGPGAGVALPEGGVLPGAGLAAAGRQPGAVPVAHMAADVGAQAPPGGGQLLHAAHMVSTGADGVVQVAVPAGECDHDRLAGDDAAHTRRIAAPVGRGLKRRECGAHPWRLPQPPWPTGEAGGVAVAATPAGTLAAWIPRS